MKREDPAECIASQESPNDFFMAKRYGDMQEFVKKLKAMGYEEVKLIPTDDGKFMTKKEGKQLALSGSTLLVGKK